MWPSQTVTAMAIWMNSLLLFFSSITEIQFFGGGFISSSEMRHIIPFNAVLSLGLH